MKLYGQYSIIPEDHTVSHPERADENYRQLAVKKAIGYFITGLILSGILLFIHFWLDKGVVEDRYEGLMDWVTSLVWGTAGFMGLFMFPYMLYAGVRCVMVSYFKPDVSTPESTLKAFLNSTQSSLTIRAYNLLTDQAQTPGKVELTGGVETLASRVPDIDINDVETFETFWVGMDGLSWKYKTGSIEKRELNDDASVLLTVPVKAGARRSGGKKLWFSVEFVAVRRKSRWFLANGFVWPV
jgi:hypothetical protein